MTTAAQGHLFDPRAAESAKVAAMAQVTEHTDERWRAAAIQRVQAVCQMRSEFTTDAVWALLERDGIPGPHEPRAMGPVMKEAVRRGWCRQADKKPVKSVMTSNHRRPVAIYASLLFGRL